MVSRQVQKVVYGDEKQDAEVERVATELISRGLDTHVKVSLVFDNFGVAGIRLTSYNPLVEQRGAAVEQD